jgi:peptidoglycan/LPS O-acetylase OafA/YrhL
MPNSRPPLFLARANYRRRRLRDGARMLPIFGLVLLILPMFWADGQRFIVLHWAYVFVIWAALIAAAALLATKLTDGDVPPEMPEAPADAAPNAAPAPAQPRSNGG